MEVVQRTGQTRKESAILTEQKRDDEWMHGLILLQGLCRASHFPLPRQDSDSTCLASAERKTQINGDARKAKNPQRLRFHHPGLPVCLSCPPASPIPAKKETSSKKRNHGEDREKAKPIHLSLPDLRESNDRMSEWGTRREGRSEFEFMGEYEKLLRNNRNATPRKEGGKELVSATRIHLSAYKINQSFLHAANRSFLHTHDPALCLSISPYHHVIS
mmetsp:Transcript_34832/g.68766  ORF Transcript_34832/g.68766 Transcript_34832/m.68766 type:complete len:217 (+) Transcript_34832:22-672(+)